MSEEGKQSTKKNEKEITELSGTLILEREEKIMCIAELKNKVIYLKQDENNLFGEIHINENSNLVCEHPIVDKDVEFKQLTFDDLLKNHNKKFVESVNYNNYKFTFFSPKCKLDGKELFDKKFTFYAMDENQLTVWVKYIENCIKPKKFFEKMDMYSTLDQFGAFIQFFGKLSLSKFLKVFHCLDANYISDPMMYSIYIIYEYLNKDIIKVAKEAIILEFEGNTQTETIFRVNSIYSKILTLIFKLYGQKYLDKTLKDIVQTIASENKKREIDPSKNPDQSNIDENAKYYQETIETILTRLYSSIEEIPSELKLILSYTKEEAKKKFQGKEEVCIGGIFFLRYFNPAFISPIENGLLTEPAKANALRSFIIITKTLQNISNSVRVSSKSKESYMMCLSELIDQNIPLTQKFLLDIASNVQELKRKPKIPKELFLRALMTFQKEVKSARFRSDDMILSSIFSMMVQTLSIHLEPPEQEEEKTDKMTEFKFTRKYRFIHEERPDNVIIRPFSMKIYQKQEIDLHHALEILKNCVINLVNNINDNMDKLRVGVDIEHVTNERNNYQIGYIIRDQISIVLSVILNDGLNLDHTWDLIQKLSYEDHKEKVSKDEFVKLVLTVDRDVRVDDPEKTKDAKFICFICESINEKCFSKNIATILQFKQYYKKDAFVFQDKTESLLIRYLRLVEKLPYNLTLNVHKEISKKRKQRVMVGSQLPIIKN